MIYGFQLSEDDYASKRSLWNLAKECSEDYLDTYVIAILKNCPSGKLVRLVYCIILVSLALSILLGCILKSGCFWNFQKEIEVQFLYHKPAAIYK